MLMVWHRLHVIVKLDLQERTARQVRNMNNVVNFFNHSDGVILYVIKDSW